MDMFAHICIGIQKSALQNVRTCQILVVVMSINRNQDEIHGDNTDKSEIPEGSSTANTKYLNLA
jgi:hypothetical protein